MKTVTKVLPFFVLMLSLMLSGCGPGQMLGPTVTPSPTNTRTPTSTPTPTATSTSTNTPTITPTSTPLPKDIYTVGEEFSNMVSSSGIKCVPPSWEDVHKYAADPDVVNPAELNIYGRVWCRFTLVFPSMKSGVGYILYKEEGRDTQAIPFTYNEDFAKFAASSVHATPQK